MTVTVVSAWDKGMDDVGRATWCGKVSYAARHGYRIAGGPVESTAGAWLKLDAILGAMTAGVEWVAWLDADAAVTNPAVTVESVVANTGAGLVFAADINGLNTGVMFWRNTDWSRGMIGRWRAAGERFAHYPNAEQTTLAYILYAEPKEQWATVPQRACNSYLYGEYGLSHPAGEWHPGDFVLHLPALTTDRRLALLAWAEGQHG